MVKTRVYASQTRQKESFFCARKTTNQTAVTTNAVTDITWQSVEETDGENNFSVAGNYWVAPSNGWLDTTCIITIDNGTGNDDSMYWGFSKNGSPYRWINDNWRALSTANGVEYPTFRRVGFPVSAGDVIKVQYAETSYAVIIQANSTAYCTWKGLFTPDVQ